VAILKCFVIYELGKCAQNIDIVLPITSREIDLPIQGSYVITCRSCIILGYISKLLAKEVLQIFRNFFNSSVKINELIVMNFSKICFWPRYTQMDYRYVFLYIIMNTIPSYDCIRDLASKSIFLFLSLIRRTEYGSH
jgi:hypothetical protein